MLFYQTGFVFIERTAGDETGLGVFWRGESIDIDSKVRVHAINMLFYISFQILSGSLKYLGGRWSFTGRKRRLGPGNLQKAQWVFLQKLARLIFVHHVIRHRCYLLCVFALWSQSPKRLY